ncbi:MAG: patatin-like phospholipase family protein [Bdellovibrionaceae bacterium]|nr:patatin-like phospholipase family protein [Pseudobdellovibrionaceae bacterium]MBX3034303.1 patatin-like phospholipase family protein [Pseudobdellovibrionaceae bacterium]
MGLKIGLVLSGGGARGAYQVGVLKGVSEILRKHQIQPDIRIYTGVSAGAINASFLASQSQDFHEGVSQLVKLWSNLTTDDVFNSDAVHMGKIAMTWATELGFGALVGTTPGRALLDTGPLRQLLKKNLDTDGIARNLEAGHFDALAITAVSYAASNSVTFLQSRDDLAHWDKARRRSVKTAINVDHVMASSAIPLLFPPAQVDGGWFGDGCVRNLEPCSAALKLGADRLLVIGVRKRGGTIQEAYSIVQAAEAPSVARVVNLILNAVLLDGVERDIEYIERVNEFIRLTPEGNRGQFKYRAIEHAIVSPSADIGQIAAGKTSRLPRLVRYLIKGLGGLDDAAEIVSYLLFSPDFCQQLIEIGCQDAWAAEESIRRLFQEADA